MGEKFKTLCVFMQKGGVGKTTMTSMLGFELAKYGKVLLVDADQQGNLTYLFDDNFASQPKKDLLSVLRGDTSLEDAVRPCREPQELFNGLYLLGTKRNDSDLRRYLEGEFRDDPMQIKAVISEAKRLEFNYVLLDLPPSFGFYEKIMLSNANEIIPIIEPEDFAIESLANFNDQIQKLKTQYDGAFGACKHLILNLEDPQKKVHRYWIDEIKKSKYKVFEFKDSRSVSSSIAYHLTMQEYDKGNQLCKSMEELAKCVK